MVRSRISPENRALARQRATTAEAKAIVDEYEQRMSVEGKVIHEAELNQYRGYLGQLEGISDLQREVLAHLMDTGMPYRAVFEAGVHPQTYYSWVRDNSLFHDLVEEAKRFANDRLERVAIALATGEYMRPLVSGGKLAAYERIHDSRILLALLKARKPEQFKDRIDVTSNGHSLVKLVDKDAWDSV